MVVDQVSEFVVPTWWWFYGYEMEGGGGDGAVFGVEIVDGGVD